MQYLFTALFIMFFCLSGSVRADDGKLPLNQRVSIERLKLIEEYQQSLPQCHREKSKSAKDSCLKKRKDRLTKTLEEMDENPRAYFIAKDKRNIQP